MCDKLKAEFARFNELTIMRRLQLLYRLRYIHGDYVELPQRAINHQTEAQLHSILMREIAYVMSVDNPHRFNLAACGWPLATLVTRDEDNNPVELCYSEPRDPRECYKCSGIALPLIDVRVEFPSGSGVERLCHFCTGEVFMQAKKMGYTKVIATYTPVQ